MYIILLYHTLIQYIFKNRSRKIVLLQCFVPGFLNLTIAEEIRHLIRNAMLYIFILFLKISHFLMLFLKIWTKILSKYFSYLIFKSEKIKS